MTATEMALTRRRRSYFFEKYTKGNGIDIGCGPVALNEHVVRVDIKEFDNVIREGKKTVMCDATYMDKFQNEQFDYVYSSHCLEHLDDFKTGLENWYRILRTGGYLIIIVPHRDYFEKRYYLPSENIVHKHYFLPFISDSKNTISLYDLIIDTLEQPKIVYLNECVELSLPYREMLDNEIEKLKAECGAMLDFSIEAVIQKKIYTPIFEFK